MGVFGWFGLALHVAGRHLIDDMILGELFGHAVEALPLRRFYVPAGDYLAMATPWSIFACAAFVRVVVQPSAEDLTRRFERFLFCWFFAGLALFSASPHTAGRLLYPLVPAAALLGGRELDRWLPRIPARWAAGSVGAAVAIAAVLLVARYHHREWRKEPIQETAALTDLARQVRDAVGDDFPLTYVDEGAGAKGKDADAMFALQIMFDTTRPTVPVARAASLLGGDAAAFVVVQNLGRLQRTLAPGTALSTLAEGHVKGKAVIHLVANRPRLAWTTPLATLDGPLRVSMDGVVPIRIATAELVVRADRDGVVEVVNESDEPHALRIRTVGPGATAEERVLAARESWVVTLGGGAPPG